MVRQTNYLKIALAGLSLLLGTSAWARGEHVVAQAPGSVQLMRFLKHGDEKAKAGLCVAPPKEDPSEILRKAGVSARNARPSEVEALARGVQQIQALGGPNGFQPIRGSVVRFRDDPRNQAGFGTGGFDGRFVNIRRSGSLEDNNVAHLIHELGHHVGHQGDLYGKYRASVPVGCHYSLRCRHVLRGTGAPRNEEFAEVFAAFVLHPELLQKGGPHCQRAYGFFADQVFPRGRELARCGATLPGAVTQPAQIAERRKPGNPFAERLIAAAREQKAKRDVASESPAVCATPIQPTSRNVLSLGEHLRTQYSDEASDQ